MGYREDQDAAFESMQAEDKEAKAVGEVVGRYVREQIADGYAYYVVTGVDFKSPLGLDGHSMVYVEHQTFFDAYSVPMIESMGGVIPLKYVKENIAGRARWS